MRGSGYATIAKNIAQELDRRGHDVKVLGIEYRGEEHDFGFSIIPCSDFRMGINQAQVLAQTWKYDAIVVGLDLPLQKHVLQALSGRPFPYVSIFPVESTPVCMSWVAPIIEMEGAMCISRFGSEYLSTRRNLEVDFLQVGVDPIYLDEISNRDQVRNTLGWSGKYVVLTVAANQERKFLSKGIDIVGKSGIPDVHYVLVTNEESAVGFDLRDLFTENHPDLSYEIIKSGQSIERMQEIYQASDVFLLPSKAEGLGLPLLEAMASNLICVGTNCTGIAELLGQERGYLIDVEYFIQDVFGNGMRYFADSADGATKLRIIYNTMQGKNGKGMRDQLELIKRNAKAHVLSRGWDLATDDLENLLEGLA